MKNKGFSFVELLVAIAILGIISLPIASSFALSAKIDAKARETYSASNAADDVLLLVTEIDSFENYGKKDFSGETEITYDLDYFLTQYYDQYNLKVDVNRNTEDNDSNEDNETVDVAIYDLVYNGYPIVMTVTSLDSFYRIDLVLSYTVAGDTMQIARKGVLPYVK